MCATWQCAVCRGSHGSWKVRETSAILACSALKRSYRQVLSAGLLDDIQFVFLKVGRWALPVLRNIIRHC